MVKSDLTSGEVPPHPDPPPPETVSQHEKRSAFWSGGEAVGWKRFRAVTSKCSDSGVISI